jgi:hypothetical protein
MLMFDSFNTWRSHEMEHRREWICALCGLPCQDKTRATEHILQLHGKRVRGHELDMLLNTSSHLPDEIPAKDCPFCDWSTTLQKRNTTSKSQDLVVPSRRFMKHLGRHLEEFALFVVPLPDLKDDDSDDKGSNAAHVDTMSTLSSFRSAVPSVEDAHANIGLEPGTQANPTSHLAVDQSVLPLAGTQDDLSTSPSIASLETDNVHQSLEDIADTRLALKRESLQEAMNKTVINGGNSFKASAGA